MVSPSIINNNFHNAARWCFAIRRHWYSCRSGEAGRTGCDSVPLGTVLASLCETFLAFVGHLDLIDSQDISQIHLILFGQIKFFFHNKQELRLSCSFWIFIGLGENLVLSDCNLYLYYGNFF